jgi:hypothetical protein
VHGFLRFIGLLNAAVWLGAAVFFTVAVGPAFFSAEMLSFLSCSFAGRAAEVVIGRYFTLQQWCGGIALAHLILEYFHSGRPVEKFTLLVVMVLFGLALAGGYWLEPKLHALQQVRYSTRASPARRAEAGAAFKAWHGAARAADLAGLAGLLFYFWRLTRPAGGPRFASFDKFKS